MRLTKEREEEIREVAKNVSDRSVIPELLVELDFLRTEIELLADNAKPIVDAAIKDRDYWMYETEKLRAALEKIVSKSHSWLITRETGEIQKPIHDSYRAIAVQALNKKD